MTHLESLKFIQNLIRNKNEEGFEEFKHLCRYILSKNLLVLF